MKEIIIKKEIENEVETMTLLAKHVAELRSKYPECWNILRTQFELKDYKDSDFIADDIENIKVSLYAAIVRQERKNEELKKKKIDKALR